MIQDFWVLTHFQKHGREFSLQFVLANSLQGWPNPIDVVFAETAAGESGHPEGPLEKLVFPMFFRP